MEIYKTQSFDIVMSDIEMPQMNGIELSREILKIKRTQKVIIVSSHNESEFFIELIKIGVCAFIEKPFRMKIVFQTFYDVCQELKNDTNKEKYLRISQNFTWDKKLQLLYNDDKEVTLSENEILILGLLLNNQGNTFSDIDIFNYIHYDDADKEFSSDAIKSLIKRLRRKLPTDLIQNKKNLGYFIL